MHIENQTSSLECTSIALNSLSSIWEKRTVNGTHSRLLNMSTSNQFINIENDLGYAEYSSVNSSWESAQWTLEEAPNILSLYEIAVKNVSIFPNPTKVDSQRPMKLFIRVRYYPDPLSPSYEDSTIHGVSNLGNIPFGNLVFTRVNSIGRQWIRQYTLALCKETLGLIRSKFGNIPVPGAEVSLNGSDLISNGREEKDKLITSLKEMLDTLTYDKLLETSSNRAEMLQKQLRFIPIPKAIFMG